MIIKSPYIFNKNIALILLGAVFFYACTTKNSIKDWEELQQSTKPEIKGKNIEIKQSKNGIVQFKAFIPEIIEQYKDDEPYIYICPKGVHIWQYDSLTQTNFELKADSAYIIESEKYFELWGNVTIERKQDSTLAITDNIFIEQQKNLIHTDATIVINKLKHIKDATAKGFESDLAFENPKFYNITHGKVNYENLQLPSPNDSTNTNSKFDNREIQSNQ